MQPNPHKSEAKHAMLYASISGETYRGVPTKVFCFIRTPGDKSGELLSVSFKGENESSPHSLSVQSSSICLRSFLTFSRLIIFDEPKSPTLQCILLSMRIFSGFKSLCTMLKILKCSSTLMIS